MKIINAHSELIDRPNNQLKLVERIGRTCYKSEDLITDDSYIKFCNGLAKRKHYAMLEHAVFTFIITDKYRSFNFYDEKSCNEEYRVYTVLKSENCCGYKHYIIDVIGDRQCIVTANLRAIIEARDTTLIVKLINENPMLLPLFKSCYESYINIDNLMQTIKQQEIAHIEIINNEYNTITEKVKTILNNSSYEYSAELINNKINQIANRHTFYTAYFQCDRGITHELVRHRPCSFAQSSTRYCNYSKGKFGNEITVIKPCFFSEENNDTNYWYWLDACKQAEQTYMWLINNGAKPEETRSVLPTSVAAELWVTASLEEWQHIINLRYLGTTGKPHPQMIEVMKPIAEQLSKYLNIDKTKKINE